MTDDPTQATGFISTGVDDRRSVREKIREEAVLTQEFMVMNAIAAVIASYGLLMNASAAVIGGMVIAMLLGPITGIALGLVEGDGKLLRSAAVTEAAGALLVLAVSWGIGLMHTDFPAGSEIMSRTAPTITDEIIALAGGVAVAYALTMPRLAASLAGVAIATALVPPLAVCGMMLARGEAVLARGALLLYVANFVAIQFAAATVLWSKGYHRLLRRAVNWRGRVIGNGVAIGLLVALTAILGLNFYRSIARERFNREVRTVVAEEVEKVVGLQLVDLDFGEERDPLGLRITVRTPNMPTHSMVVDLQESIATRLQVPTALKLNVVLTRELDPLVPPTPTPTPTATATPTMTPTATLTPTPVATATPISTVRSLPPVMVTSPAALP